MYEPTGQFLVHPAQESWRPTRPSRKKASKMMKTLWQDEAGLTTVEYALLLALVAIAAITAWSTLGSRVSTTVSSATSNLPTS